MPKEPPDPIVTWRRRRLMRRLIAAAVAVAVAAIAVWWSRQPRSRGEVLRIRYPSQAEPRSAERPQERPRPAPAPGGDTGDSWDSAVDLSGCDRDPACGVLWWTNAERDRGLDCGREGRFSAAPALRYDADLAAAAQAQAEWLAQTGVRAHRTPGSPWGATPLRRAQGAGWRSDVVGENLAWGQRSALGAVAWWTESDVHCAGLMNPDFTAMGLGLALDGDEAVWVQMFGG